jgi:UDP-glucose 4-epimerase
VVTHQLLQAGHDVVVVDDLSTGHADAVPAGATFVKASIEELDPILDATFDAVLHFAAKSLVSESVEHPERYWSGNMVATLRLLETMRARGVRRLVFSSTAATYGEPSESPITEHAAPRPINPYGQTKLAIDHAIGGEAAAHAIAAVSLRYFNVGGAVGRFGERHDPETHLIPNMLAVPAGRRESASIFGTDYPTRDGTAVRDYLHVEDLGRAHLLALNWTGEAAASGSHRIYNLGTGTGYTVREVVDAVEKVTGHPVPVVESARRPGDPPSLVASPARIASELGWTAKHDLDRIVADAWAFQQEHTF